MSIRFFFIIVLASFISCGETVPECDKIKQMLRYSEAEDSITVKLFWMENSIPQFRIDSVLQAESYGSAYYYNKDVNIKWLNKDLEKQFNDLGNSKSVATFILSGNILRNDFGVFRLDVVSGYILKTNNNKQ